MSKNTNMNNNTAVALITAHGWIGVSTPVVMTAKYLANKGYLVDIYMTEDELCNNLGIATPDITSNNIKIYKNITQNSRQMITTSLGLKIYAADLEFAARYDSPPQKYEWIIGFDPAGLIRAVLLGSAWNVPFIYHSLELCSQEDPYKEIERIFSQKALFTLIQDNARADIFAQTNGLDRGKIEIIYNSSLGDASFEKSDFLRDTFKIQKDKKIVLATGTLLPITCIDQIITSVDSWPDNFVLVLHGWIPDKNFELKVLKEIKTKKDKIFLSMEILGVDEKHKVFQSADIGLAFYNPIDTNLKFAAGSSGKIFDFMKAGVPIIGNNIPGMSELLVGSGCGMVVNNASEIGNVLHNLMDQYEIYKKGCSESFPKYEFGRCYEKLLNRVVSEIQHSKNLKKDSQDMLPLNNNGSQNRLQSTDENILRNTDIIIASYPRSGNTWVRNLLADIVLQVHGINTDTHRWEDTDRVIPDIHQKQLNNIDERLKLPYRLIKTHDVFNPLVQKTIYIFREASDSLCSYYHFLKDISKKKDLEDIDSFCINTLGEWYKHVYSYVNAYKSKGAKILFISYELLHEDPITALLSITEFLGLKVNKKMCVRAVKNQEFQKHKNQSVTFYRKGIIGSGKEELKGTTLEYIKEKTKSLYDETTKLICLSRFEQELEREFNNLRKINAPKPDERFDSFIKKTMDIATQASREDQFETALRLIVMAKYLKMPVYGLDYTRALSFLGLGQKESAVEALKEELRYFPQNPEAESLLKNITKTSYTTETAKYNSEFQEILNTVRPYTMVGEGRLFTLYQLARKVCEMDIPGNFVECGVAGGGSSALLAMVMKRHSKRKRILFSLDSFEGMPVPTEEDTHGGIAADSTGWGTGTCAAPEENVRELFRKLWVLDVVKTVKGCFKDTLPLIRNEINHIALLHMDGDWYESTRDILINIYDLVDSNGFIQVDDYGYWDGCRKAIHEFEKNKGTHFNIQKIDGTGVWFQKPSERVSSVKLDKKLKLLNLGCGSHYKEGWVNVDFNSTGPGVIAHNLAKGIPFEDGSFDVVYHSHLLEHFSKSDAQRFMEECYRVLKDGGIIRVVVPDLERIIKWYSTLLEKSLSGDHDAQKQYEWIMLELFDQMVRRVSGGEMLKYWKQNPMPAESFVIERCGSEVLNAINYLRNNPNVSQFEDHVTSESVLTPEQAGRFILSGQNHQWMYDRYSLPKLLKETGFEEIRICSANESRISNFGSYFMDIEPDGSVRKPDSLFVEAIKKEKLVIVNAEEKNAIKIVHLCMQDFGGAGGAAYRLHRGLLSIGVNSTMVVLNKKSEDPSVKVIPDAYSGPMTSCIDTPRHDSLTWQKHAQRWGMLLAHYPKRPDGLEVFRDADSDVRLDLIKEVQEADIINLHWVNGVFDCKRAPSSMAGKPVVWTIHDMNPFTGGCHYAGDCNRYKTECGKCPQLGSEKENDLSNIIWKKRSNAYPLLNINVVSPSKWLARCASESSLFSQLPVNAIPNGVPVDKFKPYPKKDAREAFNIDMSANVILFGADSVVNKRKGFVYLLKALNNLAYNEKQNILLATFGHIPDNVTVNIKYPVKNLGTISETKQLAMIYSMADLFVIPSIEDNLPNTVVESMACGTPVVGFNIGGIPDMIDHRENGYVAKPTDAEDLVKGINWILSSSEETKSKLSEHCRKKAEEVYSMRTQALSYNKLYEALYKKHQSVIKTTTELNKQAKKELQQGNIQKSKEILSNILHQSPNNIKALNNLAVTKILEKDYASAIETLNKVFMIDPSNKVADENLKYVEQQINLNKSVGTIDNTNKTAPNNLNLTGCNQPSSFAATKDGTFVDVSIVVATKNRASLLEKMLTSLKTAASGVSYEIIVIAGDSSDNTMEILRKHGINQIYNETNYLGEGKHSWPQLYNFGFSKAMGKWIMYASDDIVFLDRCVFNAIELLNEQDSNVAGGIFFYKNAIAESGWDEFGIDFTYGQKLLMNYGLIRRESFEEIKGLDEEYKFYCADGDLCLKLYKNNKVLIPLPRCFVLHNNVLDSQKKINLNDSNQDIELYSQRWKHFVPIKLPEPRRLIWNKNLINDENSDAHINPLQTKKSYTITPDSNILDQLRKTGPRIDGKPLRIHLGCGEKNLEGYVNIDYPPSEHNVMNVKADVYANITLLDYPAESVDEIRLHHVFEHFNRVTALAMIIRWHKWLKVGGKLHIETPDLIGSAKMLLSNVPLKTKMSVVRHIIGDQTAPWAYHIDHWFAERFEHTLKELGFEYIKTYPWSWKHEPYLSNIEVVAVKSKNVPLDDQLINADKLLWESTVADGEKPTHLIWTKQLRAVIEKNDIQVPENIPLSDNLDITNIPAILSPAASELPLEEIHDFNQRERDRWIRKKSTSIQAGSRILDVGAGTCPYRSFFAHCDYKSHDFKKYEGIKLGNTTDYGDIDYVSEITNIPAPDNSFDVILCTEVLEHVPDPKDALREMSRILRPGGRMLITAPLGSGLHQLPYHYYGGFSPQWYKHFCQMFGLEIKEIVPNGGFFKLLAQECARVSWTLPEHQHLHGNNVETIRNLFGEWIPRYLFALEEKHFIDQFTVGYHVDMEKLSNADTSQK
ncbi:MAG: methyltransferase domain-containing protein [Candidatus Kuenenia sp.]|nr:methyltransferase domain-containing protein [Candidatus Kuenenia hertensis]